MSRLRDLLLDRRGATIIEFALLAPVLLMMILGMCDMGYNYYMQSQLQGAIQKAARDSTIEGADSNEAAIDAMITKAVRQLVPSAELAFHRTSYASFSDVGQPEDFSDINDDDTCNDGEPFEDANRNGVWDQDRGKAGFGGARDAVLYVVEVEYVRAFNAASFVGLPSTVTTQATTVLRNQPYGEQAVSEAVGNCI